MLTCVVVGKKHPLKGWIIMDLILLRISSENYESVSVRLLCQNGVF